MFQETLHYEEISTVCVLYVSCIIIYKLYNTNNLKYILHGDDFMLLNILFSIILF